jgi:hypothetical protein
MKNTLAFDFQLMLSQCKMILYMHFPSNACLLSLSLCIHLSSIIVKTHRDCRIQIERAWVRLNIAMTLLHNRITKFSK